MLRGNCSREIGAYRLCRSTVGRIVPLLYVPLSWDGGLTRTILRVAAGVCIRCIYTYDNSPDLKSDFLSSAFPRRLSLRSFLWCTKHHSIHMPHHHHITTFLISADSSGTLIRWGGKINQLWISESLSNVCARNYKNRTMLAHVIAKILLSLFL